MLTSASRGSRSGYLTVRSCPHTLTLISLKTNPISTLSAACSFLQMSLLETYPTWSLSP